MRNRGRVGALVCVSLTIAGCARGDYATSINCTDIGISGINVTLEDSITTAKYPFTDVRVIASEGMYRDTARVTSITGTATSAGSIGLVVERPGTYAVEVTAAGYTPWRVEGIKVVKEADACGHVVPRSLVARLRQF